MIAENRIGKGRGLEATRRGNRLFENYTSVKQMINQLENDGITNTLTLKHFIDDIYVQRVIEKLPPHKIRGPFNNVIIIS